MVIIIKHEQGRVPVTVFAISGNIDVETVGEFQKTAEKSYQDGTRDLLLDLSEVTYINSSGLRVLHSIFKMLKGDLAQEGEEAMSQGLRDGTFTSPHLKLLNPTPLVKDVLKMTGFDMFLEVHRNYKEAILSF